MNRVATEDVEVRGVTIPEGAQALMMYSSANRDERVFENPDTFDIRRSPNQHIAFGFGPHFCLGSSLARLEIRTALEELSRRAPDLHLANEVATPDYTASAFVRGIKSLPVVA
jgi:cytochrome P450